MNPLAELLQMPAGSRAFGVLAFISAKSVSGGEAALAPLEVTINRANDFWFNATGGIDGLVGNRLLNPPGLSAYEQALREVGAVQLAELFAAYIAQLTARVQHRGIDLSSGEVTAEEFRFLVGTDRETRAFDEQFLPLVDALEDQLCEFVEIKFAEFIQANTVSSA